MKFVLKDMSSNQIITVCHLYRPGYGAGLDIVRALVIQSVGRHGLTLGKKPHLSVRILI